MNRVLLINMPFAGINYPSLALGLFKARFQKDGIQCDVEDLNLLFAYMVGWENYSTVPQFSAVLAGEQMFAHSLFGGNIPSDGEYRAEVLTKLSPGAQRQIIEMKDHVEPFLDHCLHAIDWQRYDVIGFTTLFEQNLPSLSLAYRVKKKFPNKVIVFGGANCEDVMGVSLQKCFPFIDYVCTGEADVTFPNLVKRLIYGHPVDDLPGIAYRTHGETIHTGAPEKIRSLDDLPYPDFDDFFRTAQAVSLPNWIDLNVLMETSRGCWWGERKKCTFCGLNGESIAFRKKSADRALKEVLYLTERHDIHFVRTVDNILSYTYFEDFLPGLAELNLDVEFFYEVTPSLKKEQVETLARARVTNVQAGIESLNSNILKLMHKGTTAIRNVEFLRWCKEIGIYVDWNMLFGFPGETIKDYVDSYELVSLVTHLQPPSSVGHMRLDRFSENFDHSEELGLANLRPWSAYGYVYPFDRQTLMDLVYYFDFDYQKRQSDGGHLAMIQNQVFQWKQRNDTLHASRLNGKVVIQDSRPVASSTSIVLDGVPGHIYEYCDRRTNPAKIKSWLRDTHGLHWDEEDIRDLLDDWVRRKLMIEERGSYLSLAVIQGRRHAEFAQQAHSTRRDAVEGGTSRTG